MAGYLAYLAETGIEICGIEFAKVKTQRALSIYYLSLSFPLPFLYVFINFLSLSVHQLSPPFIILTVLLRSFLRPFAAFHCPFIAFRRRLQPFAACHIPIIAIRLLSLSYHRLWPPSTVLSLSYHCLSLSYRCPVTTFRCLSFPHHCPLTAFHCL